MESSSSPVVSVIIITYFSEKEIRACLDAASTTSDDRVETIVIDNCSKDETINILKREYEEKGNVRLVFNEENIGFAKGVNQGAALARGKYVLILNPDTIAPISAILTMVSYMEQHPDVGILGPRITDEYGTAQESYGDDLTPWSEFLGKIVHSKYVERLPFVKKWKEAKLGTKKILTVGWIGGACALMPKELFLSIGGIDTRFFLSHGDMVDIGKKIKLRKLKAVLYPDISIIHTGSKSVAHNREESLRASYIGTLYVFQKYHGAGTVFLAKIVYVTSSLLKTIVAFPISLFKKEPYRSIAKAHFKNALRIVIGKLGTIS